MKSYNITDLGFSVECSSTGRSNSYSLTKFIFHFIDQNSTSFLQPVDININANNLYTLDVFVYIFLTLIVTLMAFTFFMIMSFCFVKNKKIPFYAWETESEAEELQ